MADDVLRMRATLVPDDVVAAARLMATELQRVGRNVDLRQPTRQFTDLNVSVRTIASTVRGQVIPALSSLGFTVGGIGVAAYGFGRAMKETSDSIIQLRNNSRLLNLSTGEIKAFAEAAERAGIAPDKMIGGISTFIKNTEDFAFRIGAVREELIQLGAGQVVARMTQARDNIDKLRIAFEHIQKLWEVDPSGAKAKRFAEIIGLGADAALLSWQKIEAAMKSVKNLTEEEVKSAEQYRDAVLDIEKAWNKVKLTAVPIAARLARIVTDPKGVLAEIQADIDAGKPQPLSPSERRSYPQAEDPMTADQLPRRPHYFFDRNRPLFKPMAFGGGIDNEDPKAMLKDAVRLGVVEGLTEFSTGARAGSGFQNAALTTGGPGGIGAGGGGGGWGSREYPSVGGSGGGQGTVPEMLRRQGGGRADAGAGGGLPGSQVDTTTGTVGSAEGNEYLKQMRAPYRAELEQNPETRKLLGAIISAENPGAGPAVAESLMNRTALVNEKRAREGKEPLSLRDMIVGHPSIDRGKSFYGPMRSGAINAHMRKMNDPKFAEQMNKRIDQALEGSNLIKGHTDQGSAGDPNYHSGGVGVNINRERFNDWGYPGSRAFRERLMARVQERAAPMRASAEADLKGFKVDPNDKPGGAASTFDQRFGAAFPNRIDSANAPASVTATGTVNVNVTAPRGTKADASSDGMFQDTTVKRTQQMQPTDEAPGF